MTKRQVIYTIISIVFAGMCIGIPIGRFLHANDASDLWMMLPLAGVSCIFAGLLINEDIKPPEKG